MSYVNIALLGKAGSGKDTTADRLVHRWAFTRLAFADPLKRVALEMNPYVPTGYGVTVRLERLIADVGWDYAKTTYPEVRRILQHSGQAVRDLDPGFWVRVLMDSVRIADMWNLPIVVTDCRYANEAEALRAAGFLMTRVTRPDLMPTDRHSSENELNSYAVDRTLINAGSIADLHTSADTLVISRA